MTAPRKYGRAATVATMIDIHPKSVWRLARTDPTFPRPLRVSAGYVIWDLDEVDRWVRDRARAREEVEHG